MSSESRVKEWTLICGFLAVIFGIPMTQAVIELYRGNRVQATSLFSYAPSEKNLRLYEKTMEDESWFENNLRPGMQKFLFRTLSDPGEKALVGRDQWLFFKPGVEYLFQSDQPKQGALDSIGFAPAKEGTAGQSVINAIIQFRDQLKERNIILSSIVNAN